MESLKELLFYVNPPYIGFNGKLGDFISAKYVLLGVPYDSTTSFRPGARFAPLEIRKASEELESYCLKQDIDFDEIKMCDLGDVIVLPEARTTIKRTANIISGILKKDKILIMLGGEHTITLGEILGAKRLYRNIKLIVFDAHMDMRDEYPLGVNFSHATVMRRVGEVLGFDNIYIIGVRAVDKSEVNFCQDINFKNYIQSDAILFERLQIIERNLKKFLERNSKIFISIDMDVLDPAFAPGVSNPEPLGIFPYNLIKVLQMIVSMPVNILGFDIVEISPPYDYSGITAFLASRIIKNIICLLEKKSKTK